MNKLECVCLFVFWLTLLSPKLVELIRFALILPSFLFSLYCNCLHDL